MVDQCSSDNSTTSTRLSRPGRDHHDPARTIKTQPGLEVEPGERVSRYLSIEYLLAGISYKNICSKFVFFAPILHFSPAFHQTPPEPPTILLGLDHVPIVPDGTARRIGSVNQDSHKFSCRDESLLRRRQDGGEGTLEDGPECPQWSADASDQSLRRDRRLRHVMVRARSV